MSGLFAVSKPSGISSAGLLRDLQHILQDSPLFEEEIKAQRERSNSGRAGRKQKHGNKLKMGHGGTLDPLASGVLVVGTGTGTKQLGQFLSCSKDYEAVALFGCSTDTYDSEGKVVHRRPWKHITKESLEEAAAQFRGDIMQTPPIYSALKMQGKPLYEYAREGKPLPAEIKARPATVSKFEILELKISDDWQQPSEDAAEEIVLSAEALEKLRPTAVTQGTDEEPLPNRDDDEGPRKRVKIDEDTTKEVDGGILSVRIKMTVSSGTYVRSLIHDLGLALGSAAHMVALVRQRVGDYKLQDAITWESFRDGKWQDSLQKKLNFGSSSGGKSGTT